MHNINYIKINHSKKLINENNKRETFKRLNTDINQNMNNKNLSLTNINFFSKIKNNLAKLEEIKEKTTNNINGKNSKILSSNDNNAINNNYLNPFDLNSIIVLKEKRDIKQKICNFLDNRNFKYKIVGKLKFICSKNDMELELKVININNGNNYQIYIIKSFHKMFKSIKSKNLYFKYLSKLFNSIK